MIVVGHDLVTQAPLLVDDEHHCLVIGPPRSRKSSAFLVPSVLTHSGPVVVTSSKADVLDMCFDARRELGPVWVLDLGSHPAPAGATLCGWSPLTGCEDWDAALHRARAMVGATGQGGDGQDQFWRRMAEKLLAPLLHAAALAHYTVEDLARWVLLGDLDEAAQILSGHGALWAAAVLTGIDRTDSRLRDSVLVTAGDTLRVYDSTRGREQARGPLLDVDVFLASRGTLFVIAPGDVQALAAPIVVGVLDDIRRTAYAGDYETVLLALDEAANIAPLPDLPSIASEGGSQGVQMMVVVQSLHQARRRWPQEADGFLTLFPHKVLLPGVLERDTIEGLAALLGEEFLPTPGAPLVRPRFSASDLVAGPERTAVHIEGGSAQRVAVISYHDLR